MTFREAITHPWLTIRVQLALGAIFVAAAIPKITDPPSFAHMIYNYRILPGGLINLAALTMPWVEILCGLLLILGVWVKPARTIIGLMLVVFMIAISINLARGNAIDCGCFDVSAAGKTYEQRIGDMWFVIVRDTGMLLMIAQLWYAERVRRTSGSEAQRLTGSE
ncbi:MAG TPA: MauE/DoxX family redox-associated membrane protein [Thermoanaerobaculia bacterium]|nr:MauE/DoxX family redox-associated membrane protein [Thermoanaerobaculia bacterium]